MSFFDLGLKLLLLGLLFLLDLVDSLIKFGDHVF